MKKILFLIVLIGGTFLALKNEQELVAFLQGTTAAIVPFAEERLDRELDRIAEQKEALVERSEELKETFEEQKDVGFDRVEALTQSIEEKQTAFANFIEQFERKKSESLAQIEALSNAIEERQRQYESLKETMQSPSAEAIAKHLPLGDTPEQRVQVVENAQKSFQQLQNESLEKIQRLTQEIQAQQVSYKEKKEEVGLQKTQLNQTQNALSSFEQCMGQFNQSLSY